MVMQSKRFLRGESETGHASCRVFHLGCMLHLIICIDLQRERQTSAMASISYRALPGSGFIATQDLAGLDRKCFS